MKPIVHARANSLLACLGSVSSPVVRLVCFPYAGGGPSVFARWPDSMPRDAEVVAVHLPGRERRMHEAPSSSFLEASESLVAAIRQLPPLPTVYFGHSLGALMALQVAQQLESQGHAVVPLKLVLAGCCPPHIDKDGEEGPAWKLDDERFVQKLRELNGTPEEVLASPELLELFLPLLRSDFRLADEARACIQGRTRIPIAVFGGRDDEITREELQEWDRHAAGPVSIRMFPGDHFFLNTERESVCSAVRSEIADALSLNGGRLHRIAQDGA